MANIPPDNQSIRWELYAPACREGQRGSALLLVITALAASIFFAIHPQGFLSATNIPALATFGGVSTASLVLFAICSVVRLRNWAQNHKAIVEADPPPLLDVPLPAHQDVLPLHEEAQGQPVLDAEDPGRRGDAAPQGARELAQGDGIEGNDAPEQPVQADADASLAELMRAVDELEGALGEMAAVLPMPEPGAPVDVVREQPEEIQSDAAHAALPPPELDGFYVVPEPPPAPVAPVAQVVSAEEIQRAEEAVTQLMNELKNVLEEITKAYYRSKKKACPDLRGIAGGVEILKEKFSSYIMTLVDPSKVPSIEEAKIDFFQRTLIQWLVGPIITGFTPEVGIFTKYSGKLNKARDKARNPLIGVKRVWNGVGPVPGAREELAATLAGYPLDESQKTAIMEAAQILFPVLLEPMAAIFDQNDPFSKRFKDFLLTADAVAISFLNITTLDGYLNVYRDFFQRYTQFFRGLQF